MQILTIWKAFNAFEWDSKHSKETIWTKIQQHIRMQILTIRKAFEAFECKF